MNIFGPCCLVCLDVLKHFTYLPSIFFLCLGTVGTLRGRSQHSSHKNDTLRLFQKLYSYFILLLPINYVGLPDICFALSDILRECVINASLIFHFAMLFIKLRN